MLQDARYALRLLVRAPGFALVSILTLALGIGANTAIFSVVRSVLLAPLPFADPDRLVAIWHGYPPSMPRAAVSAPGFYDLQEAPAREIFSDVATFTASSQNLTGGGEPERLVVVRASQSFQPTLGLPIAAGRWFTPEEDAPGDSPVVVLSDGLWRRRFGGDRRVDRPDDSSQRSAASDHRRHGAVAARFRSWPRRGCRSRSRRRSADRRAAASEYLDVIARLAPAAWRSIRRGRGWPA